MKKIMFSSLIVNLLFSNVCDKNFNNFYNNLILNQKICSNNFYNYLKMQKDANKIKISFEDQIKILEKNKIFEKEVKEGSIKLEDLIQYRIAENEQIKIMKLRVQKKEEELKKAYNIFLPTINLKLNSIYNISEDLISDVDYEKHKQNGEENIQLDLNLNLYNGNKDTLQIKKIKNTLEIEKLKLLEKYNEEIYKIIEAYVNVVFVNQKLNISNKTLKDLRKLLEITIVKQKLGAKSKGDLKLIKSLYYNNKSKNIEYKSERYNKINKYRLIVGEKLSYKSPFYEKYNLEYKNEDIKEKIKNNTTLQINKISMILNKTELEINKGEFKPRIDFSYKYTYNHTISADPEIFVDTEKKNYTAKIELNYNLFNKNKNVIDNKINLLSIKENIINEKYILDDLSYNIEKLKLNLEALETSLQNKKMEKDNLKGMMKDYYKLYNSGKDYLTKIIQVHKDLSKAEIELITKEEENILNYFKLKKLTNQLLNYFNINIENIYNADSLKNYNNDKLNLNLLDISKKVKNLKRKNNKIINKIKRKKDLYE